MPEKHYDRVRLPPSAAAIRRAAPERAAHKVGPRPTNNNRPQALLRRIGLPLRRTARADAFTAPAAVEQALQRSQGNGQPLPSPARERMEAAFGASFAGVSIHTGGEAEALTRQVDAVAFTHGHDIYFANGAFAPETSGGQRLLAHELTHVVQQHPGRKVTVGAANDPAEAEADQVAAAVVQRLQWGATGAAPAIARREEPEEELAPLRRQEAPEDKEVLTLRRQSEDEKELAQTLRRAPPTQTEPAPAPAEETSAATPEQAPADPQAAADATYREAVQAYRAGDLARAQTLFRQVLDNEQASQSSRTNAIWNIGRIYQDQGDDRAALAMYRAYLGQPSLSDERRAVAQRVVEDLEREQGERGEADEVGSASAAPPEAEAAPTAGAAPERRPSDPEARADAVYQEGVQAYRAGELRRALELFQQVLEIQGAPERGQANAIWNIGRIYQELGNDRAALTMYRTFLAQPSIAAERREVAQGIVERLERDLAGAGPAASGPEAGSPEAGPAPAKGVKEPPQQALPTAPEQRAQALQGLAAAAYQGGDYATALEHFQQLMRTAGLEQRVYTETLYNMGQCYRRMGNNGAALNMYRGFLQQPDATPEERARARQLIAMLQR